jgi:hypothetical protein
MIEGDLSELEALKQLKARYCRFLDTKDWEAWRDVFAEDFVGDTSEAGGLLIHGRQEFIAFVRTTLGPMHRRTVHQVHAPELELTSATTAKGIWAMEDFVRFFPGLNMHGYGHYHETYEKLDGRWRIKTSKLTRLREDIVTPIFSIYISESLRQRLAGLARRHTAKSTP